MKLQEIEHLLESSPDNAMTRYDCVFCRGNNTLSITKENGEVKFFCFKCHKKGRNTYIPSLRSIKDKLALKAMDKEEFILPQHLQYGISNNKSVQMLLTTNCHSTYLQGLFDVAYDIEKDRVCFFIKKGKEVVGCVGRACNRKTRPKTLNYPNSDKSTPFICGTNKDILVCVEDCPSAASVPRIPELTGMALLGTTFKVEYIPVLKQYNQIVIALDRDAREKALDIKSSLKYYHPNVKTWFLDKDIKDQTDEELKQSWDKYCGTYTDS